MTKPIHRTSEAIIGLVATLGQILVSSHVVPAGLQEPLWGLWAYVVGRITSKAAAPKAP